MSEYFLKIHVESPGTAHTSPNGDESESRYGHVWYEVIRPDGSTLQAGFGPLDPKSSLASVQGEVFGNDGATYAGNPYFTVTLRITQDQASTLESYRYSPEGYGFNKSSYHSVTNSCVDYLWKGLEAIGMNPTGFEGSMKPVDNIERFSKLTNPEFADGGLLMIERNHGQDVEYFNTGGGAINYDIGFETWGSGYSFDHWWDTQWDVGWSYDDSYSLDGTVTVGPLISEGMDGTEYNVDGTSYQ